MFQYLLVPEISEDKRLSKVTILDLCWQLSLKFGSPKTSINGETQFKVTLCANSQTDYLNPQYDMDGQGLIKYHYEHVTCNNCTYQIIC